MLGVKPARKGTLICYYCVLNYALHGCVYPGCQILLYHATVASAAQIQPYLVDSMLSVRVNAAMCSEFCHTNILLPIELGIVHTAS